MDVKERGILFSAPMVRALREDRKTVTRRTRGLDKINEAPDAWEYIDIDFEGKHMFATGSMLETIERIRCPYGVVGDRLWVRETWTDANSDDGPVVLYRADTGRRYLNRESWPVDYALYPGATFCKWAPDVESEVEGGYRPSIHMPRWASRDTLDVISARPERLQAITEADSEAEGVGKARCGQAGYAMEPLYSYRTGFVRAWHDINGDGSWAKNPWVWRVEFRRVN